MYSKLFLSCFSLVSESVGGDSFVSAMKTVRSRHDAYETVVCKKISRALLPLCLKYEYMCHKCHFLCHECICLCRAFCMCARVCLYVCVRARERFSSFSFHTFSEA